MGVGGRWVGVLDIILCSKKNDDHHETKKKVRLFVCKDPFCLFCLFLFLLNPNPCKSSWRQIHDGPYAQLRSPSSVCLCLHVPDVQQHDEQSGRRLQLLEEGKEEDLLYLYDASCTVHVTHSSRKKQYTSRYTKESQNCLTFLTFTK